MTFQGIHVLPGFLIYSKTHPCINDSEARLKSVYLHESTLLFIFHVLFLLFFPKSCSQSHSKSESKRNSQSYIVYRNSKHQTERHAKGKSNRHCILFFILALVFFLFSIAFNVFASFIEPFP